MALHDSISILLLWGVGAFALGLLLGFVTAVSATFGGRRARQYCLRVGLFWGTLMALGFVFESESWYLYAAIWVALGAALAAYIAGGPLLDRSRHRHFPHLYPLTEGEDHRG